MKIKMIKTAKGSENGMEVRTFNKDEVYEVSDTLGQILIDQNNAKESSDDATKTVREDYDATGRAPKQPASRKITVEREPLGKGDPNAEVIRPLEATPPEMRVTQTHNSELSRELAEQERAIRESEDESMQKADNKRTTKALKSSDYENKSGTKRSE